MLKLDVECMRAVYVQYLQGGASTTASILSFEN